MASSAASAVLHLQRSAGNRAVARSLQAGRRTLARYETPEHVDLGDRYAKELGAFIGTDEGKAWVKQYGLEKDVKGIDTDWFAQGKRQIGHGPRTLTPGQIIALSGDFYESWVDLATAPVEEVNEILDTIHKEREGQLANPNAAYEGVTKKHRSNKQDHYLELAKRNTPHFTPGNRKQWRKLHVEALEMAKKGKTQYGSDPGRAYDADFEHALFIDAAAGHFLTDAFAAGHMFAKDELEIEITNYLQNHKPKPDNPEMGGYHGIMDAAGVTPQLVLKNVHDRMNREGFEVTNQRGMSWKTYGDDHLAEATETQKIAALAIYVSRQQVFAARAQGPEPRRRARVLSRPGEHQACHRARHLLHPCGRRRHRRADLPPALDGADPVRADRRRDHPVEHRDDRVARPRAPAARDQGAGGADRATSGRAAVHDRQLVIANRGGDAVSRRAAPRPATRRSRGRATRSAP